MINFNRRSLAAGLGASWLAMRLPVSAQAAEVQISPGVFEIGIPSIDIVAARQNCEQWCWAASVETIFSTLGAPIAQEALVEAYVGRDPFGRLICSPASDDLMLRALSSTFDDATGRRFKGNYFVAKDDSTHPFNYFWWDAIYAELSSGRPLLAAYRTGPTTGHAVVVTHIRVRRYPDRRPDLLQMTVRDPWPQNPNRRQLELSEILALRFIAAVSVKRIHG